MAAEPIPADVKQFILQKIDSIAQLEALLLLRANAEQSWTVQAVAHRLYVPERTASPLLAQLVAGRFVCTLGSESALYQYHPESVELDRMVGRVAELYSTFLVPVTKLIHSKPRKRIQEFADAFKMRKDA